VLGIRNDRRLKRAAEIAESRERREQEAASTARRGRPIVLPRGGGGGSTADPVQHDYAIGNSGAAPITELELWIVDEDDKAVSTRAGGPLVLAPGAEVGAHMAVQVRQPLPAEQTLMVRWRDADGEHTESTGIHPPPHH
jgi:hypothetical protein